MLMLKQYLLCSLSVFALVPQAVFAMDQDDLTKYPQARQQYAQSNLYCNDSHNWLCQCYTDLSNTYWGLAEQIDLTRLTGNHYIAWFGTAKTGFYSNNGDNNGYAPLSNFFEATKPNVNSSLKVINPSLYKITLNINDREYIFDNVETLYHMSKYFLVKKAIPENFEKNNPDDARYAANKNLMQQGPDGKSSSLFGPQESKKAGPIMYNALCQKFLNNNKMAALLWKTNSFLFEGNEWQDKRFGMSKNGMILDGENKLGKMLMKIRDIELAKHLKDPSFFTFIHAPEERYVEWVKPLNLYADNYTPKTSSLAKQSEYTVGSEIKRVMKLLINGKEKFKELYPTEHASVVWRWDEKLDVTTDDNAMANYHLISERFSVTPGETIRVPYDLTIEPGGILSLGLLNTKKNGWYGAECVLTEGHHQSFAEWIVPVDETEASLVFRNYHLQTNGGPGKTVYRIFNFDVQQIDVPSKEPLKLYPTEAPVKITQNGGNLTVTTDDNANAHYQLESKRFSVKTDESIRVPYEIFVHDGIMSLGLLGTSRSSWYGEELILQVGYHKGVIERVVPAGESETSVVLRNYHLGAPGQTTFTIRRLNVDKK